MESIEEIGKHNGFLFEQCKKIQFNWILSSDASDQSATKPPVPFAVPIKTIWRVCSYLEIGFFIVKFPNRIVSLLHSEENHNKTSPKNESAKNKQSTQFKWPFYFNINRTNAFANRKKTINSPSNAVCADVRKKVLGCMIKLSETKENSFKSIFWHKR